MFTFSLAVMTVLLGACSLAHASPASLTINLRFPDGSNEYDLTSADVGHDVEIDVWATITGYNAPSDHNFFDLGYAYYGVASSLPDGPGTAVGGELASGTTPDGNTNAMLKPFGGNASQTGTVEDFNGDGVADLGPTTTAASGYKNYALIMPGAWSNADLPTENFLPTGCEFEVEQLFYHVDSLSGAETDFEPVSACLAVPYRSANWAFDLPAYIEGPLGVQNTQTSPALAGTGVELVVSPDALLATSAVPEPTTGALILVAGLVPLRRRKRLPSRNPKLCTERMTGYTCQKIEGVF